MTARRLLLVAMLVGCPQPTPGTTPPSPTADTAKPCKAGPEVCDGVDNDCDGLVDDADPDVIDVVHFPDADEDGYGTTEGAVVACEPPAGFVDNATDCNDADPGVNPGATEVCNGGVDDDCDGQADDGDKTLSVDSTTDWFVDGDGDGVGALDPVQSTCVAGPDQIALGGDCDDADPAVQEGVWWEDAAGARTDLTASFAAGVAKAPMDWVATEEGTLLVCPGHWFATLTAGEAALTVRGPGGADRTVLDGGRDVHGAPEPLIVAPSEDLTVEGVTLRNAAQAVISYAATVLDGVVVRDLLGDDAGVHQAGGTLVVRDSWFEANDLWRVVYAERSTEVEMERTTLTGNEAEYVLFSWGAITMRDVDVTNNEGRWPAVGLQSPNQLLERVSILDNEGGGLALRSAFEAQTEIVDSVIAGNHTWSNGGGIVVHSGASQVTLTDTLVADNRADGDGGGMYITPHFGTVVTCVGSTGTYGFVGNSALGDGGGIFRFRQEFLSLDDYDPTLDVAGCDFGTLAAGDDNAPDDVFELHEEISCSNYEPCFVRDSFETAWDFGDDASFCMGWQC